MVERLLKYWHSMEFFQPSWPVREKEDVNLNKSPAPWPNKNPDPDKRLFFDLYIGCVTAYDLIKWAMKQLDLASEDSPIERDQSKVCVCALKVDENGVYVPESFTVSSFVWALGLMVKSNDFNVKLDVANYETQQKNICALFAEKESPFSPIELTQTLEQVCARLSIDFSVVLPSLWAHQIEQRRKKDGNFPNLNPSTELMSSYYLRDIECVQKDTTKQVINYAEALLGEHSTRIMIDCDTNAMQEWLAATRFPLGMWPAAFSPSLMQQLAINIGISEKEMFSVNGPPGTGKTTLLKEIIASSIVQRAIVMADYNKPDDAFCTKNFESPPSDYNKVYHFPDERLAAYGILVASNNNAAVENISIELPKEIKHDRTGNFSNFNIADGTYFSEISTALIGEPSWGLISARLGKKENMNELKNRLWWAKDGVTLKESYNEPAPSWQAAKTKFLDALSAVEEEQQVIQNIQKLLCHYRELLEAEHNAKTMVNQLKSELDTKNRFFSEQQAMLNFLEETHIAQQKDAEELRASISYYKRLIPCLFKNDPMINMWKSTKCAADETLMSIVRQRAILRTQTELLEASRLLMRQHEDALNKTEGLRREVEFKITQAREMFGIGFADDSFWFDIKHNKESQSISPWTNQTYDKKREELFYRALMLHKAFILNSKSVRNNLGQLFDMWDGRFTYRDRIAAYSSLLNTLFIVVPVVSTTFASVSTFLDAILPGELGLLVIDEAGQATPQSALGALWRTKKALIVGDPMQVEPINNIPVELSRRFAEDNALPTDYRIPELSVQILADANNCYGGYRRVNDVVLWFGCPLVIHRRCVDPMFGIVNRIAYNENMFNKTTPPSPEKHFLLDNATWFDVTDQEVGNKDHSVPSQTELVGQLISKAIIQLNGFPDLYIITPFKSVERSLKKKLLQVLRKLLPDISLESIKRWIDDNCGTIHTFQGKEANEVLLVLGCDNQQGMSAARWVGQKPNIINVAVSRAKYRIGVIGCFDLWKGIPHVSSICDALKNTVMIIS